MTIGRKGKHEPPVRELTRAEEEVMQILWDLGEGVVHDLIAKFPAPKPAYNTVSTIIRILEQKGFITHKAYGRTHVYFPAITKQEYTRTYFRNMMARYFGNSYRSVASFFTREENLSLEELMDIRKVIQDEINKQKQGSHE